MKRESGVVVKRHVAPGSTGAGLDSSRRQREYHKEQIGVICVRAGVGAGDWLGVLVRTFNHRPSVEVSKKRIETQIARALKLAGSAALGTHGGVVCGCCSRSRRAVRVEWDEGGDVPDPSELGVPHEHDYACTGGVRGLDTPSGRLTSELLPWALTSIQSIRTARMDLKWKHTRYLRDLGFLVYYSGEQFRKRGPFPTCVFFKSSSLLPCYKRG
ncbi:hypothetical protein FB451DRAFT_1167060 [Mycena latifolia]|nr:hypothetical protein FB451DRAFT_1167060 [Mycena latifolia]